MSTRTQYKLILLVAPKEDERHLDHKTASTFQDPLK